MTLALSVGDPAGVGPFVAVMAVADLVDDSAVLFGDARHLEEMARRAGVAHLRRVDPARAFHLSDGEVGLAHVADWPASTLAERRPTPQGGRVQLCALDAAIAAVRRGDARAVVTAPTSKEAIALSGTPFTGQTEHLAVAAGLARDAVTMMFLGPRLCVALTTTHLSVAATPAAISTRRVVRTAVHLAEALIRLGVESPQIVVTGLNPHAGEGGLFGDEERRLITPAVEQARLSDPFRVRGAVLRGPLPAETALRLAAQGGVQGVVAMMHDQATIASKLLDFGRATNVTWGLPFVRTSVDHGVAYDAAEAGTADAGGMRAALAMAQRLTAGRSAGRQRGKRGEA